MPTLHPSSHEARLLLYCARLGAPAASPEVLRSPDSNIDWDKLMLAAHQHRVTPLLRSLSTLGSNWIPASVTESLRRFSLANAARNLEMTREFLRMRTILEANRVPCLGFKGPILAASVYGDLSMRQFGDLDVLVPRHCFQTARELYLAEGYTVRPSISQVPRSGSPCTKDLPLINRDGRILVELHCRFASEHFSFDLDDAQMWQRLQSFSLAGTKIKSLSDEDLLLLLCEHGTKHCWSRLAWIADIGAILRTRPTLDWPQILNRGERLGAKRMLLTGLLLAKSLLDAPLPALLDCHFDSDPMAATLASEAGTYLFSEVDRSPGQFLNYSFCARSRERAWHRVKYLAHHARGRMNIGPGAARATNRSRYLRRRLRLLRGWKAELKYMVRCAFGNV